MGINTNLNISPYHDDYDETKQYVRVLFKPARAVQARELTQLQSGLQNQIERMGNNIFQEGTIIEGVNPAVDKDISFVKINDQSAITDLSIYASTEDVSYFITGQTSKLRAKIVAGANGFQTDAPNLKTFFIKYLASSIPGTNTATELKQFVGGELLKVTRETIVAGTVVEGNIATVTAATSTGVDGVNDNVGKSLGVTVNDGIIYQNGHFNYVAPQLIIASKYTPDPDNISIGFTINESIVDSSLDASLLDNAQGFNNQNAPGADRLKLEPKLAVYPTSSRPEDFFALLRIERGETVFVRGDTQFKSIKQELAKRTLDESGNYVVNGLDVSVEKDDTDGKFYANISPGKAYAFGYEVKTIGNQRLEIEPSSATNKQPNQSTGVQYGSWLTVQKVQGGNTVFEGFNFKDRFNLYGSDPTGVAIGTCSIRNIELAGDDLIRIYVYAIDKTTTARFENIRYIGNESTKTPVVSSSDITNISQANNGAAIFDTKRRGMKSVSNAKFTQKEVRTFDPPINTNVAINDSLEAGEVQIDAITSGSMSKTPAVNSNMVAGGVFGVTTAGHFVSSTSTQVQLGTSNIVATFPSGLFIEHIYYNTEVTGSTHDTLEDISAWVSTTFSLDINYASVGLPNCVKLNKVEYEQTTDTWIDVTDRFSLDTNSKDGYYDISYLRLKQGRTISDLSSDNTISIRVNVVALKRTVNGGYLTPNSYVGVNNVSENVVPFPARNGKSYNLLNSYDFRPYADVTTQYFISQENAAPVTSQPLQFDPDKPGVSILNNSIINGTQEYYLGRIDKVAIDKTQNFVIVKGQPADNPGKVTTNTIFGLADLGVPGYDISTSSSNAIVVEKNTTRNYTMRDIERLDKSVKILTDAVAMSLLEQSTQNKFIPDGNGLNRFKNGIVVDSFQDLSIADLTNGDYKASVDTTNQLMAPAVKQIPVDIKIDTSSNVTSFDDVTTLSSIEREQMIIQEYATGFRNCASNFYKFNGSMSMSPQFDSSYDTIKNPDVTLNIDMLTPFVDFIENLQEFVPLTSDFYDNAWSLLDDTQRVGNVDLTTQRLTRKQDELVANGYLQEIDLGTYVTDIAMKPYMAAKEIKVFVAGLRPNTRHYFFFDEKPVSAHVAPGAAYEDDIIAGGASIKSGDIFASGSFGDQVSTDDNGRLFAVFQLPPETFYVGDADLVISDVDQFESIESGGTSFAKSTYHAYNFAVNKTTIGTEIQMADIDVETNIHIFERQIVTRRYGDPLAQTFEIQEAQGEGSSYIYVDKIDLFFKRKSSAANKNGITVEIREVDNGYPSPNIVTFGVKHLDWNNVNASDTDSSVVTEVVFDNPVRLEVGKDYAISLRPDATDPDYLVYTAKVGQPLLTDSSVNIASDWGTGVLFTSTNNKAWQSYQSEDLKFTLYKKIFSTDPGYIDLIPNDMEYFTITSTVGEFRNDEYAYVAAGNASTTTQFSATLNSNKKLTVSGLNQTEFDNEFVTTGSLVIITQSPNRKHVSIVDSIVTSTDAGTGVQAVHTVTLREAPPNTFTEGSTTITQGVGGKVAYYNRGDTGKLAIKESTASVNAPFLQGNQQLITGAISGATAYIDTIYNAPISHVQPFILEQNTLRTSTGLELFKHTASHDDALPEGENSGQMLAFNRTAFLTSEQRYIPSKSLAMVDGANVVDRFRLRVTLDNNEYRTVSPVVDNGLALLQTYNYFISNVEDNTSQYVSKPIVLQPDHPALGLTVLLTAFRPQGATIDVQTRFLLPSDPDNYTDWVSLSNVNPAMYSSAGSISDYREFEYTFDEDAFTTGADAPATTDFDAFQIKIVLKHDSASVGTNVFPHIKDYRAIALT